MSSAIHAAAFVSDFEGFKGWRLNVALYSLIILTKFHSSWSSITSVGVGVMVVDGVAVTVGVPVSVPLAR